MWLLTDLEDVINSVEREGETSDTDAICAADIFVLDIGINVLCSLSGYLPL